jgi:hypothetical protein
VLSTHDSSYLGEVSHSNFKSSRQGACSLLPFAIMSLSEDDQQFLPNIGRTVYQNAMGLVVESATWGVFFVLLNRPFFFVSY